jgi:tetratricopeptide (TPR) repeat protein
VREALQSPSLIRQIPLRLTALALAPAGDGGVEVAITSEVGAGALSLEPMPDGSRRATLDVAVAVSHVRPGASQVAPPERLAVRLPAGAGEGWLPLERRLTLPPGLSQVKVAVRDRGSGTMGTVVHSLEVPDPARLRVSSPILSNVPGGEGVGPPRLVARRRFEHGSVLYCYFEVFPEPGSSSSEPGPRGPAYEVVDRRGKVRIRSALPLPVRGEGGGLGRLVEIPLFRIEPGEYELVLDLAGDAAGGPRELREPFSVTRPSRFADDLYRSALDAYLDGDFRRAVATVLPWPAKVVGAAAKRLSRTGGRVGETALLLHTDLALVLRRHGLEQDARDHLSIARTLAEGADAPDLHREWLLALAHEHQSRSRNAEALAFYSECARVFPGAGEARLGAGTLHEGSAFFPAAFGGGRLNLPPRRAARAAERSYRDALHVQPALTEARLRLARVLQMKHREEEAVEQLSLVVGSSRDPSLLALAHLFWGEIRETRDDSDGALAHYRAALDADGSLQVAALALARILHQRDGRSVAVDALVPALGEERSPSPWLSYRRGPLRLSGSSLREMRLRLRAAAGGPE